MTLEEAMKQSEQEPTKRIIRAPNNGHHFISVWFYAKNGVLMVHGYPNDTSDGVASFQTSEHTDYILI
jgi:hypothetical protein